MSTWSHCWRGCSDTTSSSTGSGQVRLGVRWELYPLDERVQINVSRVVRRKQSVVCLVHASNSQTALCSRNADATALGSVVLASPISLAVSPVRTPDRRRKVASGDEESSSEHRLVTRVIDNRPAIVPVIFPTVVIVPFASVGRTARCVPLRSASTLIWSVPRLVEQTRGFYFRVTRRELVKPLIHSVNPES